MKGILADHCVRGQVDYLAAIARAEPWAPFWNELGLVFAHFDDIGLTSTATDREVWLTCQTEQFVLITANRNQAGPESLEETIRTLNNTDSLPVLTIADLDRLNANRTYAEEIVESMLDYLQRIDSLLGTGRLWLP